MCTYTQRASWRNGTTKMVAVGTIVAAFGTCAAAVGTWKAANGTWEAAYGTREAAKAVTDSTYIHSKTTQSSILYKEYAKVGKCLAEIEYFYQDRQRKKDDKQYKLKDKRSKPDREAIAKEWAEEKRSNTQQPSKEVKLVDDCRQRTINFFKYAYLLLDDDRVDRKVFKESFYARSGNFKDLVEPLDKANFDLVNGPTKAYKDGNNRPGVYVRIEKAEEDPDSQQYFRLWSS